MAVRGGWLLLVLMFSLTLYDMGWISFPGKESPALRVSPAPGMQVMLLDTDGRLDGIHQINDAQRLIDVINLAGLSLSVAVAQELLGNGAVSDGKMIKFQHVNAVVTSAEFGWMPAAMRMSLSIPLQMNQMSQSDWDDLPGIGPSLALRIAQDRHKNGDFGSIDGLKRVHGIGLKSIEKWRPFFVVSKLLKNN